MSSTLSVITVSYNAADTIRDTIDSVAAQSYPNTEHIVIDGGSSDGTVDVLKDHDRTITNWISEPDAGLYDAMNKGIGLATGDFVGFLNADDAFARTTALEDVARTLEQTGADATHGDCLIVRRNSQSQIVRYYTSRMFRKWQLRFGIMPPHSTIYTKRELLLSTGGFRTDFRIGADFDLLIRLFLTHGADLAYVPGVLTLNRHGGLSTRGLASTFTINREFGAALRANDVRHVAPMLWARYFLKVFQFVSRPRDFPPSTAMR